MRHRVRQGAQLLVKSAAAARDVVRAPDQGLVVLAYHRVGGGSAQELDLDPAVFADQMAWLADSGRAVDLDEGLRRLAAHDAGEGEGLVAVTFDDGTADFIDHALAALVANNVPATYYVATDFIEQQRSFPDHGTPMTWTGLAEAVSTGLVSVGSHTHTHAVLDKVGPDEADRELRVSAELIAERLATPAEHFAYPKGVFGGEENGARVARYYRSAALANCRVNLAARTDPLRLDRTPIQRSDRMTFFRRKALGGMGFEGELRDQLNRRRYGTATT